MTRPSPLGALGRRSAVTVAALALGSLCVQSCGEKESLVVVSLTTTPANATLTSVTIDVDRVSKTFALTAGLSPTATTFGVYVPSSVTGSGLLVAAAAKAGSGSSCFEGSSHVDIPSAGVTAQVTIDLRPSKSSCTPPTTGAAGSGGGGTQGAAGTQGTAGTGAAGTIVAGAGGSSAAGAGGTTGAAGSGGAGGSSAAGAGGTVGTAGAGGTTGMAGAGGSTGMAGAGGSIQIVAPPGLTKCTEYSHIDALVCTANSSNSNTLVWEVAFSPDGSLLATAGDDSRVKIWKMTGSVPSAEGHVLTSDGQGYLAFSPDGKYLAVGSNFGTFELYDAKTFQMMGNLAGHSDDIEGVAFTVDSKHVWSIDLSGVLTRHDIGAGTAAAATVTTGLTGYTLALAPVMTSTVQWLALGFDDGTGDIANVSPGMTTPTPITVSADASGVYGMSFSPDGKTLVAGGHDGFVSFWDLPPPANGAKTGMSITLPNSMGKPEAVKAVKFSPDGKYVAIAAGDPSDQWRFGIYDAPKRQVLSMKTPTYTPLSLAWSPSEGILVGGEDTCGKFIVCSDK